MPEEDKPSTRETSVQGKEEKLEFLKREEIRTMQKDIAHLREIEAQRERERITALKPEKIKKRVEEKVLPEIPARKKEEIKEALAPRVSRKLSPFKKIFIRGIIVLFVFFFFGFLVWSFWLKKPPTEEFIPLVEEEIEERPEVSFPPSLIPVEETKILEVSKNEEIPAIFNQLMAEEMKEGTFLRVLIKKVPENQLVSLKDLASAFQITAPEEIYQKLESDFTLAIYFQEEGKRIALVAKIREKEDIDELLKNLETKVSKEGVFVSGEKVPTLIPYFKTSTFRGINFRYLTISEQDLGICYTHLDDYFLLTTSFESIQKLIDKIKTKGWEEKFGQLFIVGFEEKTVTPALEEFFRKYKPGGVLLLSKNIENKEQLKNLISDLQDLSLKETGLPLFIAVDQEGEPISRIEFLEEKTSQSEIKDTTAAFQIGQDRGKELQELGVNLNLAPVLDNMKSGDFYFNRTFQKSPELSGELAKSLVLGQKEAGILMAIKHFPGYVNIPFNPENRLAEINLPEISQFKKAMEANPELVMVSNVIYKEIDPALPFAFSSKGIKFLKDNLGSEVLVLADDLSQNSLLEKFSLKEIVTLPIEAGVDVLIFSGHRLSVEQGLEAFLEAVKNKEVSEVKINTAASKIIQLKQKLLE